MNQWTPILCLMAHMGVVSHLMLLFYRFSGSPELKTMLNKFSYHQQEIYKEIKKERKLHYLIGLLLGTIVAMLYLKTNPAHPICAYLGLSMMIAQNFYLFMPNKKWMVDYIETPQDIYNWNRVYQKFRYLSVYGNFLGFVFFTASQL